MKGDAIFLNDLGLVCALGQGTAAVREALFRDDAPGGVAMNETLLPGHRLALGAVSGPLPSLDHHPVPLHGRNNALLRAAYLQIQGQVRQAIERYGPSRVAVVVGTSTSGIGEAEQAMAMWRRQGRWPEGFHYVQQEIGAPSRFLAAESGARGPAWTISGYGRDTCKNRT